jgi:hypothetical protein
VGQIFDEATALASRTPARTYDKQMPRWWPTWMWQPTIRTKGGRLVVPLVAVLDEAANTVLLRQLPTSTRISAAVESSRSRFSSHHRRVRGCGAATSSIR